VSTRLAATVALSKSFLINLLHRPNLSSRPTASLLQTPVIPQPTLKSHRPTLLQWR